MASSSDDDKVFRFPEGEMTLRRWVKEHAERLEERPLTLDDVLDRRRFNKLEGRAQEEYVARAQAKVGKPHYTAWKGDQGESISKALFDWATREGVGQAKPVPRFVPPRRTPEERRRADVLTMAELETLHEYLLEGEDAMAADVDKLIEDGFDDIKRQQIYKVARAILALASSGRGPEASSMSSKADAVFGHGWHVIAEAEGLAS